MVQDNVCHDLAVNKTAQPGKYYGTGQAGKVSSRAGEYPADGEAAPGLPVQEGGFIRAPPPTSSLPRRQVFQFGNTFQGPVDFHGDVLVPLVVQKKT